MHLADANVGIKNNQRALDTVSIPLGAVLGTEEQELHSPDALRCGQDCHAFSTKSITVSSRTLPAPETRHPSIPVRLILSVTWPSHVGITAQLQAFQPPIGKRAKITYRNQQQTQSYPKGTSCVIIELCARHKMDLADAEDYAVRGFHALTAAY
ncbi:hypothetical protein BKA70DRAFT_1428659 [Coprinopsis sp. MPI-PUGE-AT-0042]|nr:hypothetical protein BKA70DRAFT_1428659 [Coprinopsis sp. MPI-PUGE-AT-0042]